MTVKLTVLGSGTSSGVPVIGCDCAVCQSPNPKNNRMRSSCLIQTQGKNFLIDTGPDLRNQCLRFNIKRVDAVLYTHIHADHTHGIDELRLFNAWQKSSIPVFGEEKTLQYLQKTFSYVFDQNKDYQSLKPNLIPHPVEEGEFDCLGVPVTQIPCHHGPTFMTYNYRIGNIAWLTDTNGIPKTSEPYLKNLDYLFIDGLRERSHPTHFCLDEAIEAAKDINAKQTYFIHLAHDFDHDEMTQTLPKNMSLAFDGLTVES